MIGRWAVGWMVRWFRRSGWRFIGPLPRGARHLVVVAGPHTGLGDFRLAVAVTRLVGFKTTLLVDKRFDRWYYRSVLKAAGALPWNRQDVHSWKPFLLEQYRQQKRYSVVFTAHSPRDPGQFDTTWLDVALEAKVPVMLVGLDHTRKYVRLHSWFFPTGNRSRDVAFVRGYFDAVDGRIPGSAAPQVVQNASFTVK